MKLWFVIYIVHTVVFTQQQPPDMGRCEALIPAYTQILKQKMGPVNVNISPQYLPKPSTERTMYCMWSEKDPAQK